MAAPVHSVEVEGLGANANALPSRGYSDRCLCEPELLATGASWPLERFIGKPNRYRVRAGGSIAAQKLVLDPSESTLGTLQKTPFRLGNSRAEFEATSS